MKNFFVSTLAKDWFNWNKSPDQRIEERKAMELIPNHAVCTYSFETFLIDYFTEDPYQCQMKCDNAL